MHARPVGLFSATLILALATTACGPASAPPPMSPPAPAAPPADLLPSDASPSPTLPPDSPQTKPASAPHPWRRITDAAFDWLVRHQGPDGRWDPGVLGDRCDGPACGGRADSGDTAATTALAVLAFLGMLETPQSRGASGQAIRAGRDFLVSVQDADGSFRSPGDAHPVRTQAHATRALAACAGLSSRDPCGASARRGHERLLAMRIPGSAWGERGTSAEAVADLTTTAWALCAVSVAGSVFETPSPPDVSRDVLAWLDALPADPSPEAAAMRTMCRVICGATQGDAHLQADRAILERSYVAPVADSPDDVGRWFRAQAAYQWGGDALRSARAFSFDVVAARQRAAGDGCARGSWDPPAAAGESRASGPEHSRIGATALALGLLTPQFHSTYRNAPGVADTPVITK